MYRGVDLNEGCERLGLPTPPAEGSKHQSVKASLAALPDAKLPMVAENVLASQVRVDTTTRNAIQDILWAGQGSLEMPKRTRREIARNLDLADLVHNADRFTALLDRLWVLDDDPFSLLTGGETSLRARIERHVFRNPGDWTTEELFEQLGAFEATNARFVGFLEGLVSADTVLDEPAQRHIVDAVNPYLHSVGVAGVRQSQRDSA